MEFQLDDKGSAKKVKNYRLMFFVCKRLRHNSLTYFLFEKTADRRMLFFDTENFIFRRTESAA